MAPIITKSRDSLLTTSSGYTNYRGILNLVVILLVLSNTRAALENVIKYGILVDPLSWFVFLSEGSKHWPPLLILLGLGLHVLVSLAIEKLIASCSVGDKPAERANGSSPSSSSPKQQRLEPGSSLLWAANGAICVNLFACIALPPVAVYTNDTHPISTSLSLMMVSIVFLKLVSYHMMNFWCRDLRRPEKLQARSTRSFLRSYVPPEVEFGLQHKPPAAAATTVPAPTGEQPAKDCQEGLRRRALDTKPDQAGSAVAEKAPGSDQAKRAPKLEAIKAAANSSSAGSSWSASREEQQSLAREVALRTMAKYPANVSLRDLVQFLLYPTLCYELEFAKTERIRKRFLVKRLVELVILSQLDMALIQQWIVPTVSNSVLPFRQMQFSHMLERLLKLAIPNHVIWLIWFYAFFHSLLNIVAELTRFADREFYRDWWNSESVYYFWGNWNIPVHKWCARHLYVPLLALGLTKCQASTAVFFVSAFFHEFLVSVPLKMFRMWAFTGMLIQLPWARFVSAHFNSNFANVAVWVSLIIGQPLCILMYYHDYYVIHHVTPSPMR